MKIKLLLTSTAVLFFSIALSFAQPSYTWAKQFGGINSNSIGYSIAVDDSGNVYTAGIFDSITDFDPGASVYSLTSSGASDIFISKLSPEGNLIWVKQFTGDQSSVDLCTSLALDGKQNIYLTGKFGHIDFDPGQGVNFLDAANGPMYICKLNASGDFIWARQMGSGGADIYPYALTLDDSVNIFTTGYFKDSADFNPGNQFFKLFSAGLRDIFISKLDSAGNFVWAQRIGGRRNDVAMDIAIDKKGNVFTTGNFNDTVDFDPGTGVFNLVSEAWVNNTFVNKLDNSGKFIWAKMMGGIGGDGGTSVSIDNCGNVYTSGYFIGTSDFDPSANSTFTLTSHNFFDIFISKLNPAGNFIWAKNIGGSNNDYANTIEIDVDGNFYLAGRFNDTLDFDPDTLNVFQLTASGQEDIFVAKYDAAGKLLCVGKMGGINNDVPSAMVIDKNDNVFTTGFFNGPAPSDFDPGVGTADLVSLGTNDVFISKLGRGTCCIKLDDPSDAKANSAIICFGDGSALNVVPSTNTCPTWYWYESSCGGNPIGKGDTISVSPVVNTTYFVRAEGPCDTTICKSVSVTVKLKPFAHFSYESMLTCDAINNVYKNQSLNANSYSWNFGDGSTSVQANPEHKFGYNSNNIVSLVANNSDGCSDTFSVQNNYFSFSDYFNVSVPNIFTPNNDEINDEMKINYNGNISSCFSITIFDRWGLSLFDSTDPEFRWTGKSRAGTKAVSGTYFYVININNQQYKGYITLLE